MKHSAKRLGRSLALPIRAGTRLQLTATMLARPRRLAGPLKVDYDTYKESMMSFTFRVALLAGLCVMFLGVGAHAQKQDENKKPNQKQIIR